MYQQTKTLDWQIRNIFSTILDDYYLPQSTVKRVSELLKIHLQDVVAKSLKCAMWRDPTSSVLDERDLLHVISKMDDKYKYKIGMVYLKFNHIKQACDTGENIKAYKTEEVNERADSSEGQSDDIQSMIQDINPVIIPKDNNTKSVAQSSDSN